MKQFRITKYNPKNRDESGVYLAKEWTEYSDVGSLVSEEEYEAIESNYIQALKLLLEENQIRELKVIGLENAQKTWPFIERQVISSSEFSAVFRGVLRGHFWCKFESKNAFVHFGWDYYSYIGVESASKTLIDSIFKGGLYVEDFDSPYAS